MTSNYPNKCFIVSKKTYLLKKKVKIFVGEESLWEAFFSAWGKGIFDPVINKLSFIFRQCRWNIIGFWKVIWVFCFSLKKTKEKMLVENSDWFSSSLMSSFFICSLSPSLLAFSIGSAQLIWVWNFSEYYFTSSWIFTTHWPEDRTLHPVWN